MKLVLEFQLLGEEGLCVYFKEVRFWVLGVLEVVDPRRLRSCVRHRWVLAAGGSTGA